MFSDEWINFMKSQEADDRTVKMITDVRNLIGSLNGLKKSFSDTLSRLFVENDIDGIQELINYGNEIDEFIEELSVLDFGNERSEGKHKESTGKVMLDTANRRADAASVKTQKHCVLCGQPVWKDTDYCKEHIAYDKADKEQAGGVKG